MTTTVSTETQAEPRPSTGIVDCDVHNSLRARDDLKQYLASRWHPYLDQGIPFTTKELLNLGAVPTPGLSRMDSFPDQGPPGSDLELMRAQLLDEYGIAKAILHPVNDLVGFPLYGEPAGAIMAALNDWMVAEWLDRDDRFWAAISIPFEDGVRSAAEIERASADRRFAKVMMTMKTREGLGHPKYWPIYEAAEALGLPVAAHVGGFSGTATATGWPPYAIEYQVGHCFNFATQLTSLVYSGVFDRFPRLQFIMEEAGLAWMPPLMWRLDRTWKAMRAHVPHLERRPTEVIREHIWVTTQPLEQPHTMRHLLDVVEQLAMNDRILFATDYPHFNFDDPRRVLPASIFSEELRARILRTNAESVFARAFAAR